MLFVLSTTKVVNSRFFKRQNVIWRRRLSPDGAIFTTRERVDMDALTIIKNSGDTQRYMPGKLYLSLFKACDHLPDAADTAWQLRITIEEKLLEQITNDWEITSQQLAIISLETLNLFNKVAYLKYGSYQPDIVSTRKLAAATHR